MEEAYPTHSPKQSFSRLQEKDISMTSHSLSPTPVMMFNIVSTLVPPTKPRDHHLSPVRPLLTVSP